MSAAMIPAEVTATAAIPPEFAHSALTAASALLDRPAILGPDRIWTWREVHEASLVLSRSLGHASAVCNLCTSRLNFLVTWLAALRSHALLVLPPSGGHAELSGVLGSTPHPIIVADHADAFLPGWHDSAECLVCVPVLPERAAPAADLAWQPAWERTSVLLYTSGTTGAPEPQPKTLLHLALGALALGHRLEQDIVGGLRGIRRIVCSVAPQHMFGVEASVMLPLIHAIPVQEGRPLLPADVRQAFGDASAAAWIATPLHLRGLTQAGDALANCSVVVASTMPLTQSLAQATEDLVNAAVLEIYGSTETGVLAMRRTARETAWTPIRGARVEVIDGSTVAYGAHFPSPVHLPDAIALDETGRFALLGRASDMIKIGGRRASLAGLNRLLQDLPGLDDGVWYLPSSTDRTARLCLIYSGAALDRAAVAAWLRDRIDAAFLPRAFIHVAKLPRNDNGKLPRQALDEIFAAWQRRARKSRAGP